MTSSESMMMRSLRSLEKISYERSPRLVCSTTYGTKLIVFDSPLKYQYPRDVQGEVWKQWFEQRNNRDTIIKMNTGSGKTVVALMILQSCLNEGIGPAM